MEVKRRAGRGYHELREIKVTKNFLKYALGSCLIEIGDTKVVCAVNMEDRVPPFLRDTETGWITAEYSLLPSSTSDRISRGVYLQGRSQEIKRMIGRSLRAVVDLKKLGERTLWVDCDVIQADGGTRTAAINGSFIAMVEAFSKMKNANMLKLPLLWGYLGAVSVGIVHGSKILDLDYSEDSAAGIDFNVAMTGKGEFVELQATAEGYPFKKNELFELLQLAEDGIGKIIEIEKRVLKDEIDFLLGH
jgi:ribonuclease PH